MLYYKFNLYSESKNTIVFYFYNININILCNFIQFLDKKQRIYRNAPMGADQRAQTNGRA